eukprot:gene1205-2688_t
MPDVHAGKGATVGTVIPTHAAVIPAAVGVDIGCGMVVHSLLDLHAVVPAACQAFEAIIFECGACGMRTNRGTQVAAKTSLSANELPENLSKVRSAIEAAVPHGREFHGKSRKDSGSWCDGVPKGVGHVWASELQDDFDHLVSKHPRFARTNNVKHLGTLGTGNHFVEICLDEAQRVWVMLHSGSRGIGNAIGTSFIEQAKRDMQRLQVNLPDSDLAYLREGTQGFDDYVFAVGWAQRYAKVNRECMMRATIQALRDSKQLPPFTADLGTAVNCHHNYVQEETHFGKKVWLTRKGAVSAREGQLGIIPGSMGARSYIVRGRGNPMSFNTCSHGAGRVMSRTQAKKVFTIDDHAKATAGVECRKDAGVIDETPAAYKDIDAVMAAQDDLVDVVHVLKQ